MPDLRASEAIQGNVLAPFPDGEQAFLLFHFSGAEGARALLADILPGLTTTARLLHSSPRISRAIGLTASGLAKLEPAWAADLDPFIAFREGPALRAPRLRDHGPGAPERWVFGAPDGPVVDAVLTLAAAEPGTVDEEAIHWRQRAHALGVLFLLDQRGARLPGAMAGCEHFGFKDGISQPAVAGFDEGGRLLPSGEFILGRPRLVSAD